MDQNSLHNAIRKLEQDFERDRSEKNQKIEKLEREIVEKDRRIQRLERESVEYRREVARQRRIDAKNYYRESVKLKKIISQLQGQRKHQRGGGSCLLHIPHSLFKFMYLQRLVCAFEIKMK